MKEKFGKGILYYVCIVSIINLLISLYIEINKAYRFDSCFREMAGCAIVDASSFSSIAGMPLTIIGMLCFIFLALLSFLQIKKNNKITKNALFFILLFMAIFSLYLLYLQFFVIKEMCRYCLIVDFLTLSMFFVYLFFDSSS